MVGADLDQGDVGETGVLEWRDRRHDGLDAGTTGDPRGNVGGGDELAGSIEAGG
jgi:hypothetical protein